MNHRNTFYEWNKEKWKGYAQNCHYLKNRRAIAKDYENSKENLQIQAWSSCRKIFEGEKIKKKNMEELDLKTCLNRINKS